ncbi:MAG: FecR family protein [Pseudomonadota bacterium]
MRSYSWFVLFLFSVAYLILSNPIDGMAEDLPVGRCSVVTGKVTIKKAWVDEKNAVVGDSVVVGDILRTEKNSIARVMFIDDSFINLSPETSLMIKQYIYEPSVDSATNKGCAGCYDRRKAIIKLQGGIVRFVIFKQRGKGSSFNVETNNVLTQANISDFVVTALSDETEVAVLSGSVSVKNISPLIIGTISVGVNQKSIIKGKTPPSFESINLTLKQRKVYLKNADF